MVIHHIIYILLFCAVRKTQEISEESKSVLKEPIPKPIGPSGWLTLHAILSTPPCSMFGVLCLGCSGGCIGSMLSGLPAIRVNLPQIFLQILYLFFRQEDFFEAIEVALEACFCVLFHLIFSPEVLYPS